MGLGGYYSWFVPNFADLTCLLTNLMGKATADLVQWKEQCQVAFERVREDPCEEPLLNTPPNFSLPFVLRSDVSDGWEPFCPSRSTVPTAPYYTSVG